MNLGRIKVNSQTWRLLAVFALALTVRLVYNLYCAQHRILDVGDSFYYLTGAKLLAKLVRESQSLEAFLGQLCTAAKFAPGSFHSFSALGLSDRLLIDGPVYPTYLAAIFLLTGRGMAETALNANQLVFALANCFTDALLAAAIVFLGETAFGITAGVIAGLLWCFYFPAVINTQQCYGEPLVALLLTVFLGLMLYQSKLAAARSNGEDAKAHSGGGSVLALLTGVVAGLLMLSKPVFVVLPPLLILLHLIALAFGGRLRRRPFNFLPLIAGAIIVIAPWLVYTRTVSGAVKLMVNRAPGYNLYIGNYLPTDGWKTWPVVPGVPDSSEDARRFIQSEAERQPWALLSLLLRKVARLWVGVWNDFHMSCFGFSYGLQNVFQSVYLLIAALGLSALYAGPLRKIRSFSFVAGTTLAWTVAFHFVYTLFEPVPRYAFTAMPAVLALAAVGAVNLARRLWAAPKVMRGRLALRLLFLILFVSVIAAAHALKMPVFYTLASGVHSEFLLRAICALSMFVLYGLLCFGFIRLFRRMGQSGPLFYAVIIKCFTLAALIAVASALGDPAYLEYSARLTGKTYSSIATQLSVPDLGRSVPDKVYLLIDAQAESGAPDMKVIINEKVAPTYGLPLYELTAAARDIPVLINLQSKMMDVDQRTFRQWWVYPVDSSLIHFGGDNTIALFPVKNVKVFGNYFPPRPDTAGGENVNGPNLTTFSWSKGFLTADSRDPRPYEETYFRGQSGRSWLTFGRSHYDKGALRVRLAVPMPGPPHEHKPDPKQDPEQDSKQQSAQKLEPLVPSQAISLFEQPEEKPVAGQSPIVFEARPVTLPGPLTPSSVLHLSCQLRRPNPSVPATMALSIEYAPGKSCTPIWQPSCIRLEKEWQDFDFKTVLPSKVEDWHTLTTHLLLSPYPVDRLYLHRKEALKDTIFVRKLKIEIMPPPIPGAGPASALRLM